MVMKDTQVTSKDLDVDDEKRGGGDWTCNKRTNDYCIDIGWGEA